MQIYVQVYVCYSVLQGSTPSFQVVALGLRFSGFRANDQALGQFKVGAFRHDGHPSYLEYNETGSLA